MSEEDYYIDVLKDEEEPAKDEYSWGSEPSYEEKQPDYYQQDYSQEQQPYQQEFYGEGYYQDYQTARPPREEGPPWFWIGILIGIGVSAVVMVIFNFVGTSFHPGLAFLEMVLLLICCIPLRGEIPL